MAYKVVVEPEGQKEIDNDIEYYSSISDDINVQLNLLNDIDQAYKALELNPFFQIRSKHYRALPLRKYPYLMFFEILKEDRIVKLVSLFNTSEDPKKHV